MRSQASSKPTTVSTTVSTKALLAFFLPLAASSMMMMGSHSIISSALAKTTNAAVALAAYAVASSVSALVEAPCHNIRRMAIALFDDKTSYSAIRRASFIILAVTFSISALIAFGPLGPLVFQNMLGISDNLYPEVIKTFRLFLIFPFIATLRAFYQGLIIKRKRTYIITINMIIRLLIMLPVSRLLPRLTSIPGVASEPSCWL